MTMQRSRAIPSSLTTSITGLVIFVLLSLPTAYPMQGQVENRQFQHLGVKEGLSHTSVFSIYQTHKGELLFGTANGLNKYNGYDFEVFYADMADSNAISSGNVSALWEDPVKGYIWIATWGGGVNRFDPKTQHFHHYLADSTNIHRLSDNRIQSLLATGDNTLWLGTFNGGLNQLNRATGEVKVYRHLPNDPQSISHNRIWDIKETDDGKLWLATSNGLNLFDPHTGLSSQYLPYPTTEPKANVVRALHLTDDGLLWVGTQQGLLGFDTDHLRFIQVPIQQKWNKHNNPSINALIEYPKGTLWICTQRNGLVKYEYHQGHYEQYLNDPLNPQSISDNDVRSAYVDDSHVLWVATRRAGLSRITLQDKLFTTYTIDPIAQRGLSDKQVLSIAGEANGGVWVGTTLGGVDKIDEHGEVSQLPLGSGPNSVASPEVHTMYQERPNLLWIGTEHGLQQYNPQTQQFRNFSKETPSKRGLHSERISLIHKDLTSRLWLGTKDAGLYWLNTEADTFVHVPNLGGNAYSNVIQCIADGPPRELWVGTEGGLLHLDTRTLKYTLVEEIAAYSIRYLYKNKDSILWIGTTNGLVKYNINTQNAQSFTTKDGLPSNQIDGILAHEGYLWISTGRGLCKMDVEAATFRNYDMGDGLQSNVFSMGACYKNPFGKMYFGGIEGLNSFYAKDILDNKHKPPVILTKFSKMGKTVYFNQPLDEIERIDLSHTENVFGFEFAALDFAQPHKNEYAYMLEGYDDTWVYAGNNRSVSYSHIPPGDYTFRFKGSNNDKVWNEQGTAIKLIIHPPFWQTLWFYTLCFLGIVGSSVFYTTWRIQMLKKQRKQLSQEVSTRTHELEEERDKLKITHAKVHFQLGEIEAQRDEIEAQRDDIIQKNRSLEGAIDEIKKQNEEIRKQKTEIEIKQQKLENAQSIIQRQNEQLLYVNHQLEEKVQQRTKELNNAYKELLRAHKQLDHFTYRSAHDLKGPIARLLGLCYLGKIEITDAKAIEYLHRLEDNAQEMNTLIARLMRAYEVKTKNIDLGYVSLAATIQHLWASALANEHTVDVSFDLTSSKEVVLFTDIQLFQILLENVLLNAIQFRRLESTGHKVKVSFTEIDENVHIKIEDWGIGVDVAIADKLFDMFVIGSQQSKGAGLGLYEAQIIAQRLKGKIWLEEYGQKHTIISVLLPIKFG